MDVFEKIQEKEMLKYVIRLKNSPIGYLLPISEFIFDKLLKPSSYEIQRNDISLFSQSTEKLVLANEPEDSLILLESEKEVSLRIFYKKKLLFEDKRPLCALKGELKYFSINHPFAKLDNLFTPNKVFRLEIHDRNGKKCECQPILQSLNTSYLIFIAKESLKPNEEYLIRLFTANDQHVLDRTALLQYFHIPRLFFRLSAKKFNDYSEKWLTIFIGSGPALLNQHLREIKNKSSLPNIEFLNITNPPNSETYSMSTRVRRDESSYPLFFLAKFQYYERYNKYRCYLPKKLLQFNPYLFSKEKLWIGLYDHGKRFELRSHSFEKKTKQFFIYLKSTSRLSKKISHIMERDRLVQVGLSLNHNKLPEIFPMWKLPELSFSTILSYHIKGNRSLWIGIPKNVLVFLKEFYSNQRIPFLFKSKHYYCYDEMKRYPYQKDGIQLVGTLKLRKDSGGWLYSKLPEHYRSYGVLRRGLVKIFFFQDSRIHVSLRIFFSLDPKWPGQWIGLLDQEEFDQLNVSVGDDVVLIFRNKENIIETGGTIILTRGRPAITFNERMPWFKRTFFKEDVVVYPQRTPFVV